MVYAIIGTVAFRNTSRRDNAHTFITTRLVGETMWGAASLTDVVGLGTDFADQSPALRIILRFVDEAARDACFTDLVAQLQGANGPVAGAWIAKHTCHHDESPPQPCVEGERHVF